MRRIWQYGTPRALVLLSAAAFVHSSSSLDSSITADTSWAQGSPSTSVQSTCQSGTVNYITHTLRQQCLTSTRSGSDATTSSLVVLTSTSSVITQSSTTTSLSTLSQLLATAPSGQSPVHSQSIAAVSAGDQDQDQASNDSTSTTSTELSASSSSIATTRIPTGPVASVRASTITETDSEIETDSPLDNAHFLSFDEWKKQNLVKAGQSPDHVGQQRSSGERQGRTRPGINNALDVLGEDSEIELDFSGFGGGAPPDHVRDAKLSSSEIGESRSGTPGPDTVPSSPGLRSKDAGKTCKERTNYASFDCAATVVKTNPECKAASSVLIENKDSYMLNICSKSNKFFIVELCDDILIDTVVLANYEFFSSIFRTFRLSVADRYPVKADRWRELGVFEARNTRGVQAFLVEQPLIWARYLRVEFLTHYGNEYYCPVSLVRVHGTTMMEEFRHQEDVARGEDPDNDDVEEATSVVMEANEPDVAPAPTIASTWSEDAALSTESEKAVDVAVATPAISDSVGISSTVSSAIVEAVDMSLNDHAPDKIFGISGQSTSESTCTFDATLPSPSMKNPMTGSLSDSASRQSNYSTTHKATVHVPYTSAAASSQHTQAVPNSSDRGPTAVEVNTPSSTSLSASAESSSSIISQSEGAVSARKPTPQIIDNNGHASASSNSTSTIAAESVKHGTATSQVAQALPTTQESFFKSIHKRLQMLESNATLSLQYIEEQSRILRDAFTKVEKRQIRKTETFLDTLNATVSAELSTFRQQYDHLWQSTVIELQNHREQYQREISAVSTRLTIVADELVFQKRMVIVQSTLLVMCLALLLFARAGSNALELPLIQQMVSKSQAAMHTSYYSPPVSPALDQSSPPAQSRRRRPFWRSSSRAENQLSEAETSLDEKQDGGGNGPQLFFQSPTPTSVGDESPGATGNRDEADEHSLVPEIDADAISSVEVETEESLPMETQSSPATPTGTREGIKTLSDRKAE